MAEMRAPVTRLPVPGSAGPPRVPARGRRRPRHRRGAEAADGFWQRLANQGWLRKAFILVVIAVAWELYARRLNNPLLVPTFSATLEAFWSAIASGDIPQKVSNSVLLLLKGYALGLVAGAGA